MGPSVLNMDRSSNIGVVQQDKQSFEYNGESDLDLEYAMALTDPTPITLLQTGEPVRIVIPALICLDFPT